MLRLRICLLIAALLLGGNLAAADEPYTPLTDAEVRAYMDRVGEAGVIADIRRLDLLEHAVPTIVFPPLGAILTVDGELILWPMGTVITIAIADVLRYQVTLDPLRIPDFHRDERTYWHFLYIPLACAAAGAAGCAIARDTNGVDYALAAGLGALIGLGIAWAMGGL